MSSKRIRVLMVDDEPLVLFGLQRLLRNYCDLTTAESGPAALKLMDEGEPFHVVFADMRMPDMDGVEFIEAAQKKHGDSVYIMLTGNADQRTAVEAINRGQVFRFVNKPCPADQLEDLIVTAGRRYEANRAEKMLLRETLMGSVKLLVDTIMISRPALGRASELIARDVEVIRLALGLDRDWRVPLAGSLCLLGCSVSNEAGEVEQLTDELLVQGAEVGGRLLRRIPRLEDVAQMIERQRESGPMAPDYALQQTSIRVQTGARLLRFVVDFHRQTEACMGDREMALRLLERQRSVYDQRLVAAAKLSLDQLAAATDGKARRVRVMMPIRSLEPGMELAQDVQTHEGQLLLRHGQQLNAVTVERLQTYGRWRLRGDQVAVMVDEVDANGTRSCA